MRRTSTASRPGSRGTATIAVHADRVRLPLSPARIRRIVGAVLAGEKHRGPGLVTVTFLGPTAMARLHRRWKGRPGPTDVLTFTLYDPVTGLAGDLYLCAAVARRHAAAFVVPWPEEIVRLLIHGTLHLLGYDHPDGPGRTRSAMWSRQEHYVRDLA
jgi:probable rRNA maturation factor